MDGLRALADSNFETNAQFDDRHRRPDFDFIHVHLQNGIGTIDPRDTIPKDKIVDEMGPRHSLGNGSTSSPQLRLLEIRIGDPFPFYIDRQTFLELSRAIKIDAYILHLIVRNSYGFFQFPATPSSPQVTTLTSYYVSTVDYILIWSHNSKTMETKAMLLTRGASPRDTAKTAIFEQLGRYLHSFMSVYTTSYCPSSFLTLVVGTQLVHFLDRYILSQLMVIRQAEALTGHGDMVYAGVKLSETRITALSQRMGGCLTVLANIRRHLRISNAVLAHVSKTTQMGKFPDLEEVVSTLSNQVTWNEEYITYLLERTRSQMAVLQGLLSHEDAIQGKRLAVATKEDSSAMKTIAVMTMLFLPGTFFAALFAMPLLKWDGSQVIQNRFWVYWAFTLPATALVFLVWKVLTSWSWLCDWYLQKIKKL
ncbi:hypothetical protein BCR34DRAFT_548229 [Clohesyomyces aquaticus]|uniref:Cora-like Mg2+ transporter protein-domain-containing protein n=1 Tax=Clohesyomyces aquaticus TaxID=1231657 RepID=A0A1Y1YKR8_9PLEO|nr:hypothetical protein BCR34DRAFT_548229 [Clohesyomyces aquaticus]